MEHATEQDFPELYQLIRAYLNQDYTINGPELEDSVYAFIEDSVPEVIQAAREDIARFLVTFPGNLDAAMEVFVRGDWARLPGTTAHDYLLWLDGLLAGALEHNGQHV